MSEQLRQRGLNAGAACRQKIAALNLFLTEKCGDIAKSCPTMFYDKKLGLMRPIRGTDPLEPCVNYRCALDQMSAKNDKYHLWLLSGKWPGSVSASADGETRDITDADYIELAEQIEKFCTREVSQVDAYIRAIPERKISFWDRLKGYFGGEPAKSTKPSSGDIVDGGIEWVFAGNIFGSLLIIIMLVIVVVVIYYIANIAIQGVKSALGSVSGGVIM